MRGGGAVDEERRDRGATNDWLVGESYSHRKTTTTTATTTTTTGTNVKASKIQESHTEGGM